MSEGIHVTGLEVKGFQRIRAASVKLVPGRGLVRVTGGNKSGKTSLLRAISAALGGAAEVLPDPIFDGEEEGAIHVVLSNGYEVSRRFTPKAPKGYLTVEGPDGGKHAQAKLSEWLGPHSFDPLAFFRLPEKRQNEVLLSLGSDPKLAERLAALRDTRKATFTERTPLISRSRMLAKLSPPSEERPGELDISALVAAEDEAMSALTEYDRADVVRNNIVAGEEKASVQLTSAHRRLAELVSEFEERQRLLEKEVQEATLSLDAASLARDEVDVEMAERGDREQLAVALEAARKASRDEASSASVRLAWQRHDDDTAEAEECGAKVAELTELIESSVESERKMLSSAGIPVDGVSFNEEGDLLLNGHPLSVASGAERMRFASEVAVAVNPDLKVCLLDEGNDLDLKALAEMEAFADETGFQIWVARIDVAGKPGDVHMDDGATGGNE